MTEQVQPRNVCAVHEVMLHDQNNMRGRLEEIQDTCRRIEKHLLGNGEVGLLEKNRKSEDRLTGLEKVTRRLSVVMFLGGVSIVVLAGEKGVEIVMKLMGVWL
jgi:hypothetical protein